jgi:hypothetical protein
MLLAALLCLTSAHYQGSGSSNGDFIDAFLKAGRVAYETDSSHIPDLKQWSLVKVTDGDQSVPLASWTSLRFNNNSRPPNLAHVALACDDPNGRNCCVGFDAKNGFQWNKGEDSQGTPTLNNVNDVFMLSKDGAKVGIQFKAPVAGVYELNTTSLMRVDMQPGIPQSVIRGRLSAWERRGGQWSEIAGGGAQGDGLIVSSSAKDPIHYRFSRVSAMLQKDDVIRLQFQGTNARPDYNHVSVVTLEVLVVQRQ